MKKTTNNLDINFMIKKEIQSKKYRVAAKSDQ